MRTKLLVSTLFLMTFVSFSQTTVLIPDAAFEAYLEDEFVANITPDGSTTDGSITFTDIDLVIDIDFNTPNVASPTTSVSDLTGVSSFPKLKYLIARNNDITGNIDLSGLTSLSKIYIDNNPNLTGLGFTNCENLQQVKASKCNLENLDLSTANLNTSDLNRLTDVDVDTNNLSVLNITGHTGIDYLDFGVNPSLTNIDISSLTLLTLLRFQNCDITGDIDVSANLALVTLAAYNNDNLTSIALGSIPYTNFTYFKINSNDALTCVYSDNPTDFEIGGALNTAIGSSYAADAETFFIEDALTCSLLAVEDVDLINFNIYPNPAKDIINIHITEDVTYKILNMNGQILESGKFIIGNNELNLITFSKGMYFFQIATESGNSFAQKLIKE